MDQPLASAVRVEIVELLGQINDAWTLGKLDRLHDLFHDEMVIMGPDGTVMGEGREVCVQSYADFANRATVHGFRWDEPVVHVWAGSATCHSRYEIDYEVEGERKKESGGDFFLFVRVGDGWRVAQRIVLPG
jgi:hypothetical protein